MGYRVISLAQQATVAEGTAVVVSYDYAAGRKTRLPDAVRDAVSRIGGAAG
jgi:acyl-CoA thioesterase FadM